MNERDEHAMKRHWIVSSIVAPVVVAVVVGMATGYLTVQVTLATYEERITTNTRRIDDHEISIERASDRERKNSERLIRLETKIDLLLDKAARH